MLTMPGWIEAVVMCQAFLCEMVERWVVRERWRASFEWE